MMDGSIGCESRPGEGSRFWFRLPLAKSIAPPLKETDSRDNALERVEVRRRVLVVEDNSVNRMVAVRLLARQLCEVDAVESGRQALDACTANEYDVIFMDVNMPDMDGFQTTAEIRRGENNTRRVPIVAMTARAMKDDRELCLAAGMDDYLSKPLDSGSLGKILEKWAPKPLSDPLRTISNGNSSLADQQAASVHPVHE